MLATTSGEVLSSGDMDEIASILAMPGIGYQSACKEEPDLVDDLSGWLCMLVISFLMARYDVTEEDAEKYAAFVLLTANGGTDG